MSEFAVGEVAIYWYPGSLAHNTEVTIVGPLRLAKYVFDFETQKILHDVYVHDVDGGTPGTNGCACPKHLRKKRPPQDWIRLCNLNSVPNSCIAELA